MSDVALFDAKNRLSELINRVEADKRARCHRGPARSREGVSLGRLVARDLIDEGRR